MAKVDSLAAVEDGPGNVSGGVTRGWRGWQRRVPDEGSTRSLLRRILDSVRCREGTEVE